MPKEGDTPGPCCEAMVSATRYGQWLPIRWCVDEMASGSYPNSFTGWGVMVNFSCWYGEFEPEYAPAKFCPFCGGELREETK